MAKIFKINGNVKYDHDNKSVQQLVIENKKDLSFCDLSYSDLSYSDLFYSNLSGSNLSGSNLSGSDLSNSNLSYSNLSGSNLSGSDLSKSNLSFCNLSSCNLFDIKNYSESHDIFNELCKRNYKKFNDEQLSIIYKISQLRLCWETIKSKFMWCMITDIFKILSAIGFDEYLIKWDLLTE